MSDENYVIELDDDEIPIFLARAPGQVADQGSNSGVVIRRGARSGNPNADAATGKFQKGGAGNTKRDDVPVDENPVAVTRTGIPQGVDIETWNKRLDIVRDAARKLPIDLSPESVNTFLKDKVNDLSQVNVQQFIIDVRQQNIDDLIDIFDNSGGRGTPNLKASKSYVKRTMAALTDEEVLSMARRLMTRGMDEDDIKKVVLSKISDEDRREALTGRLGGEKKDDEADSK